MIGHRVGKIVCRDVSVSAKRASYALLSTGYGERDFVHGDESYLAPLSARRSRSEVVE
jgi:hypothetical protein